MTKDAEVRWYIIRRVMQERTWGRSAVRMREESDSSAGRKPETICCWLPAVPPTSLLTFLLFSLSFTLQSMKVLSHLLSGSLHTPGTPHTCSTEPSLQFICEFIFFIETLRSVPLLINLQLPCYPSCLFLCDCTIVQTMQCMTQTSIYRYTPDTHTLWRGLSNGFWRFQFPLCHRRQKTLWAQLPLSHIQQTRQQPHSHTLTRTLSYCDIPRNTQSRARQANWEEY